ncbi:MAG: site-specific recombinase XerD [Candidatus Bathyarchaeota archaeon B26-1]|nr:MAG: site-specific recombinase XerD [Candidatus Bathyarchaeota archaeon B26-1]
MRFLFLDHKNIKNTLIYVQLEEALFKNGNIEFICKAAKTVEEAKALIEGVQLFRKRKCRGESVVPRGRLELPTARSSAGCSPSLSYRGLSVKII